MKNILKWSGAGLAALSLLVAVLLLVLAEIGGKKRGGNIFSISLCFCGEDSMSWELGARPDFGAAAKHSCIIEATHWNEPGGNSND